MKAVAYETSKEGKRVRVVSSAGFDFASDNAQDLLIAVAQTKEPGVIAVVWDTALFWKPIFNLLPATEVNNLTDGKRGRMPGLRLWWGITRHGRVIGINYTLREHIKGNFYNESKDELEISELKQYFDEPRGIGNSIKSNKITTPSLTETATLGQEVITTLIGMGLQPKTLMSAIAIYKDGVLDKLPIPVMLSMPESTWDAHELAWNTVDEWSVGYKQWSGTEPAFSYDLSNAYGAALADLPNLYYAEFVQSKEIPPPGFCWGVMSGIINNKTLASPLVRPETGYPYVGFWKGAMTTDLYACLRQWDIADMEIKDGWYIYLKRLAKPFSYSMRRLYGLRGGSTLQDNLAKAMSVATWGKLLETRDTKEGIQYGDLFNPIYGSMVVNAVKVKVTDFIYSHGLQDDLISVTVDGVKTGRDLDIPTDRRFGEWRKGLDKLDRGGIISK